MELHNRGHSQLHVSFWCHLPSYETSTMHIWQSNQQVRSVIQSWSRHINQVYMPGHGQVSENFLLDSHLAICARCRISHSPRTGCATCRGRAEVQRLPGLPGADGKRKEFSQTFIVHPPILQNRSTAVIGPREVLSAEVPTMAHDHISFRIQSGS